MLLVILYILYNLGYSIFSNYKVNEKIIGTTTDINSLKQENELLKNQNLYYQTNTFKELEARRKLGMKADGENVIITPDNKDQSDLPDNLSAQGENIQNKTKVVPNYVKWWQYMMGE